MLSVPINELGNYFLGLYLVHYGSRMRSLAYRADNFEKLWGGRRRSLLRAMPIQDESPADSSIPLQLNSNTTRSRNLWILRIHMVMGAQVCVRVYDVQVYSISVNLHRCYKIWDSLHDLIKSWILATCVQVTDLRILREAERGGLA